jgi:hypothetical protein
VAARQDDGPAAHVISTFTRGPLPLCRAAILIGQGMREMLITLKRARQTNCAAGFQREGIGFLARGHDAADLRQKVKVAGFEDEIIG